MRWWPPFGVSREFWTAYWTFARRIVAFLIDWLILAVPATILIATFSDALLDIGIVGRLVGFVVFTVYFAALNSSLTGGRSLGMRATGLRIVDAAGEPLSFARSLVRSVILAVPLFAVGTEYSLSGVEPGRFAGRNAHLFVSGRRHWRRAVLLLFANWRTRQMLHDLTVGSFVVRKAAMPDPRPLARWHLVAIATIVALSLALPSVPIAWFDSWEPGRSFALFFKLQKALADDRSLFITGYSAQSSVSYSSAGTVSTSSLQVKVHVYGHPTTLDPAIKKVAAKILELAPDAMGYKFLAVEAGYGVDLGFTSWSRSFACYGTPVQWQQQQGTCPGLPPDWVE